MGKSLKYAIVHGAMKKRNTSSQFQIEKFREVAREISGEMPEAEFDRALGQIGRANVPKDDVKPADRRKRAKRKPLKVAIGDN